MMISSSISALVTQNKTSFVFVLCLPNAKQKQEVGYVRYTIYFNLGLVASSCLCDQIGWLGLQVRPLTLNNCFGMLLFCGGCVMYGISVATDDVSLAFDWFKKRGERKEKELDPCL